MIKVLEGIRGAASGVDAPVPLRPFGGSATVRVWPAVAGAPALFAPYGSAPAGTD